MNIRTRKGAETKGRGYEAENLVKEKLWRFGYAVEHQNTSAPFDLLVDKKFRVEVKTGKLRLKKNGDFYWNIMMPEERKFDILAIALPMKFVDPIVLFFNKENFYKLRKRRKRSNKYEKAMPVYAKSFSEETFNLGVRSPYEVFGKPIKQSIENL